MLSTRLFRPAHIHHGHTAHFCVYTVSVISRHHLIVCASSHAHPDDSTLVALAAADGFPPAETSSVGYGFLTWESPIDISKLCYKLKPLYTTASTRSAAAASVVSITTNISVDSPLLLDAGIAAGNNSNATTFCNFLPATARCAPGRPPGWLPLLGFYLMDLLAELAVYWGFMASGWQTGNHGFAFLGASFIALFLPKDDAIKRWRSLWRGGRRWPNKARPRGPSAPRRVTSTPVDVYFSFLTLGVALVLGSAIYLQLTSLCSLYSLRAIDGLWLAMGAGAGTCRRPSRWLCELVL